MQLGINCLCRCKAAEVYKGVTCGRGQTTLTYNHSNPLVCVPCCIALLFVMLLLPVGDICLVFKSVMIPKNPKVVGQNTPPWRILSIQVLLICSRRRSSDAVNRSGFNTLWTFFVYKSISEFPCAAHGIWSSLVLKFIMQKELNLNDILRGTHLSTTVS